MLILTLYLSLTPTSTLSCWGNSCDVWSYIIQTTSRTETRHAKPSRMNVNTDPWHLHACVTAPLLGQAVPKHWQRAAWVQPVGRASRPCSWAVWWTLGNICGRKGRWKRLETREFGFLPEDENFPEITIRSSYRFLPRLEKSDMNCVPAPKRRKESCTPMAYSTPLRGQLDLLAIFLHG